LTFFVSRITTLEIIRAMRKRFSKIKYYLQNVMYKKVYINKDELYEVESVESIKEFENLNHD